MTTTHIRPPAHFADAASLTPELYSELYQQSISDPEGFWAQAARELLVWDAPWSKVLDWDFGSAKVQWFDGGRLNVSVNCLDRHLAIRGDKTAIIWEGNEPGETSRLSYRELHHRVCSIATLFRRLGVQRGDRVAIYMPMIPDAAACMLACTRIGAIHSVVFAGFSAESLKNRILDCGSKGGA
jgi:acetyl-CoA synthetase